MSAARKLIIWEALDTLSVAPKSEPAANDNVVQALDDARENSRLGIFSFAHTSLPACEPANDGTAPAKSEAPRRTAPEPGITGKEEDGEVGLQYFGFRYLNPLLGRWVSPDPLEVHSVGKSGEFNVYAYVSGAVLLNTDPLGLADGTEGQSGAGTGDGNETDEGYDADGQKEQNGPQQEAAAQAEAERKTGSYLAGLEAGEKASDELHRPWENSLDSEKAVEKRGQIEAAKRVALATCGDACKGYEQDFNEAFDSGYRDQELHRSIDGMVKTAVYVGLAGAGSPKNSVGSGSLRPPSRAQGEPARRAQTAGDKTHASERAARRQAMRDHDVATSKPNNYKLEKVHGKNENLTGKKGEPSEILKAKDQHGSDVKIEHHKNGHEFKDNNTFEKPHYHGPKGEHHSY